MRKNNLHRTLKSFLAFGALSSFLMVVPIVALAKDADAKVVSDEIDKNIITGTVREFSGEPAVGALLKVSKSGAAAITDVEGHFTIKAPAGSVISISYLSAKAYSFTVKAGVNNYNITLEDENKALDEIVVMGYSAQKRNSLTGSMQSIDNKKLTNITTANVTNMLSGKVTGLNVSPGSGRPGSFGALTVRGKSTINGSTAPLWVIDGVIVGRDPGSINPNDIETLNILKDAASTAIYGSQGANGVIVITTKSAKQGRTNIDFTAKVGISNLNNGKLEMMNGADLYDYYKSFTNQEIISFSRWNPDLRNSNFDWWKLATHTGSAQDYHLTVTSSVDKLSALFSAGAYLEDGAVIGYKYKRYNTLVKLNFHPYQWLSIRPEISGNKGLIDNKERSVSAMYSMLPWDNPYDSEGNIVGNYPSTWVNSNSTNYMHDLQYNWSKYDNYSFNANFDFDIYLNSWLTFTSVNSYRWFSNIDKSYTDPRTSGAQDKGRVSETTYVNARRYTNQLLKATKSFGKYNGFLMLGYEFNDGEYKYTGATGTGIVPGYSQLSITSTPEAVSGNKYGWAVQSLFANFNADYDNKYMLQLSLRTDGASNFGDDAKWGTFYAVSGGWVLTKENWFKTKWIDYLKVRVSYGSVGSRPNSLYPQYGLYSLTQSYDERPGAVISQIANKNLTWEKTYTAGVGIDLNIFKRARFTFDLYNKRTNNLLYGVPVSGVVGVTSIWQNVGELTNTGFEMTASVDVIKNKDFTWTIDANISTNRNKIKRLYGEASEIIVGDGTGIAGSASLILKPGYSSDTYYMREWAGVDPQNGAPLWYYTADDGSRQTTSSYARANQVILNKHATPKVFGGFSTTLTYKNFDLNALFGYQLGGYVYNYSRLEYDSDGAYTDRNQMKLKKGWTRWEKEGDIATHPAASYNNSSNSNKASTRFLEKSDFLKLRSMTLGYNFLLKSKVIQALRLYITGENLLTFTSYSGVDPEVPAYDSGRNASGERQTAQGITAVSSYPSVRKWMLGINITF